MKVKLFYGLLHNYTPRGTSETGTRAFLAHEMQPRTEMVSRAHRVRKLLAHRARKWSIYEFSGIILSESLPDNF